MVNKIIWALALITLVNIGPAWSQIDRSFCDLSQLRKLHCQ